MASADREQGGPEDRIDGDGEGHPGPAEGRDVPRPGEAVAVLVLLALLFLFGAGVLFLVLGEEAMESGLLVAQVLFLLLPVLLVARLRGFDARRTFFLRRPEGRELLGGILIIGGGLPLAWFLAWLQGFVIPVPTELLEQLEDLVTAETVGRYLWLLLLLAVTPAICEEFVFRGFFLSATERRFSPVAVIILNGAVFGLFHMSFQTAFRVLPTAFLGILLAAVVWKTRSIWTGVLMHGINNAIIVTLASVPALELWGERMEEAPPLLLLVVGLLLVLAGVRVLAADGGRPLPSAGGPGAAL